jgi:tetratricopeptide (TPR) repeat protein/predicted Ser/Thr protein kinase
VTAPPPHGDDAPLSERALLRLLAIAASAGDDDDDAPPSPPDLPPRYRFVRELGRGGMGVVHEVVDTQLGRHCALKVLAAANGTDAELRRRFAREAAAAARLRHPHIAAIHDATADHIAMQLVDGGPIGTAPELPPRAAVALVRDAARALHHAHEQGVVHRDLKPSNLLVERGHVFVVDFGLAKAIDAQHSQSLTGEVLGTPAFMPPEQALGQHHRVGPRSDVYGLGATLYWSLAARPPFAAPDLPALLRAVVHDDPRPTGVDRDLDLVLAKCLAKEPEQRYPSAAELADDLDRWLADEPVRARAPSLRYRLQKRLRRHRTLLRAATLTALAAAGATALVLVPAWLRASAARTAAAEAVALADHGAAVLAEATLLTALGEDATANARLDVGIARVGAFLERHDLARVRYLLARLLQLRGRGDDALRELDRALVLDPGLDDARFERGLRVASQRELSPAQRAQAIADLSAPTHDRSAVRELDRLFGRAQVARLQGDLATARELLQEVVEQDAMHAPALRALGDVATALGDHDLARNCSASAIDVQIGYAPFYLARERRRLPATMLGLDGFLEDFSPRLDDAPMALARAHRALAQLRRALRLADEQRLPEAVDTVLGAIAEHETLLQLEAGEAAERFAGAHVNHAVCCLTADALLRRAGDTARAVAQRQHAAAALQLALAADPHLATAHANVAVLALREAELLGAMARADASRARAADAVGAFERALQHAAPDWPHARACRERLAAARALAGS